MSAPEELKKWPLVQAQARKLEAALRWNRVEGSYSCALQTVALLRNVVGSTRWHTAAELMQRVKGVGARLEASTQEAAVGNAVRRVLSMIREDYASLVKSTTTASSSVSLQDVFAATPPPHAMDAHVPDLKPSLMEQILEFYDEIESGVDQSQITFLKNDVVLTVCDRRERADGEKVIAAACRKCRHLLVVVSEEDDADTTAFQSFPNVTFLPETAVVAVMPRVDTVIFAARSVAGDGSFLAAPTAFLTALAAKNYSKNVLVVAALYKFCPDHALLDTFQNRNDPTPVLSYADLPSSPDRDPDALPLHVANPDVDHVPAHLVDLFLTNDRAHQPSYVGRLLAELYSPHDHSLLRR